MKNIVSDNSYVVSGTVIDEKEDNYSSTSVSTDRNYHINSHVTHHQEQLIWYTKKDGSEDSVRLYNCNVEFRQGHRIALIYSRKTNRLMRVVNLTTKYYWRINYKKRIKGVGKNIAANLFAYPVMFLLAIFSALPFINILTGLFVGLKSLFSPGHHYPVTLIVRLLGLGFFVSVIAFWIPVTLSNLDAGIINELQLDKYLPYINVIDLPAFPYMGNAPPAMDLTIIISLISVLSIFLLYIRDSYLHLSLSAALDNMSSVLINEDKPAEA